MAGPREVLGVAEDASLSEIRAAHRELARRWHPDRFAEGPERMWAEKRMTEINMAFEELRAGLETPMRANAGASEAELLQEARALLDAGYAVRARRTLMKVTSRSAEWNYLFGAVLMRQREIEKALIYLGVACRQCPWDPLYEAAYRNCEALSRPTRLRGRLRRFDRSPERGKFGFRR